MEIKIVCFSVAAMDYFSQQDAYYAGGNSLNQAIRFRKLGFESAFLGAIGNDEAGEQIRQLLITEDVDISQLVQLEGMTAKNEIVNDEMGERFGVEGAWQGGVYETYRLKEKDWNFLSHCDVWATHTNCPNFEDALRRKTQKQFLAVDFLHLNDFGYLRKCLPTIDVAFFGGTKDMISDLEIVAKNFPKKVIVLTLGKDGSIAFQGKRQFIQPALEVDVIDTTGCGDAFQAGFTSKFIITRTIEEALLMGATLGKQAAQHFGGVPWRK